MNLVKSAFTVVFASVMAGAFAASPADKPADPDAVARRAAARAKMLAATGGYVDKPDSQRGKIALINTQSEIPDAVFEELVATERKHNLYNFVLERAEAGDPEELKARSKADFAVIVVADDKAPAALAALEDGWAVVNVRKLSVGLGSKEAKERFLNSRCQKEVLRALAAVAGGLRSQFPNNVLSLTKISDLDHVKSAFIPNDALQAMKKYMAGKGVTPKAQRLYIKACQEGWAPAPTNDFQKAIWDKVHAMPTEPIRIKPETKKIVE